MEETLDDVHQDFTNLKSLKIESKNGDTQYEGQDYFQDLGYIYTKTVVNFGRLYGPSIIVGAVSVAALTGSHIQLTRRNAALSATLAVVSKAYDDYRIRVQEEIGKDRELDIHRAMKNQEVEIDGKKKNVKNTVPNWVSPYARWMSSSRSLPISS